VKSLSNGEPLGMLLRRAATSNPDNLFVRRGDESCGSVEVRTAELDQRADRHRSLWRAAGLGEGARVGLIATPEPEIIAAVAGAVRAGVEVVLLSPSLEAPAIAASAGLARALALAGPAEFAGVDYAKRLAEARAAAGAVTWLMLWELDRPRLFRLDNAQPSETAYAEDPREAGLAVAVESSIHVLDSFSLYAVAGEFARALGLTQTSRIVSLVSPASPAGLIVSAHAPLATGAKLIWQAPFSANVLDELIRDPEPAHLVAPASIARQLSRAGLLDPELLASLTLVVSDKSPPPIFDTDLDEDRVFFLSSQLGGARPFSPLSADADAEINGLE
jgi:acyl-CoA synthetase (AMP-forming)/AMP-acid ligase II